MSSFWMAPDARLRVPWALLTFAFIYIIASFTVRVPLVVLGLDDSMTLLFAVSVVSALGASYVCVRAIDGTGLRSVGMHLRGAVEFRRALGDIATGTLTAVLMIAVLVGTHAATGTVVFHAGQVTAWRAVEVLGEGAAQFLLVAVGEEVLVRGFPYVSMARRIGGAWTVMLTAIVFGAIHLWNPHMTELSFVNIVLAGVWLGVARYVSGTLWLAIGLHLGWNFALGTLAGYPVSGLPVPGLLVAQDLGPVWLTGGFFGPEGGLACTVVLLAGTAALLFPPIRTRLHWTGSDQSAAQAPSGFDAGNIPSDTASTTDTSGLA